MNRIFPAAITPLHKQVPHVDYDRPWYLYELPASFDASTSFTTRGAHICYFETASLSINVGADGEGGQDGRVAVKLSLTTQHQAKVVTSRS